MDTPHNSSPLEEKERLPARPELMERFNRYDFRDKHGHPLINCADFLELFDRAFGGSRE